MAADRLPPQNIEAEQSVLGSLLIDPDAIIKVAGFLQSTKANIMQGAKVLDSYAFNAYHFCLSQAFCLFTLYYKGRQ